MQHRWAGGFDQTGILFKSDLVILDFVSTCLMLGSNPNIVLKKGKEPQNEPLSQFRLAWMLQIVQ